MASFIFKKDFMYIKISFDPHQTELRHVRMVAVSGLTTGPPAYSLVGLPPSVWSGVSELGLVFLTGYIRTGSIFLAQNQDRLISLKRVNSRLKYV